MSLSNLTSASVRVAWCCMGKDRRAQNVAIVFLVVYFLKSALQSSTVFSVGEEKNVLSCYMCGEFSVLWLVSLIQPGSCFVFRRRCVCYLTIACHSPQTRRRLHHPCTIPCCTLHVGVPRAALRSRGVFGSPTREPYGSSLTALVTPPHVWAPLVPDTLG